MKISELLNESQGVAEGREKFNTDLMKPGFRWSEEINGITYRVRTQWDNMPEVVARVNNREVGRATFIDHHTRSGLESVSTYVSPKWQGHGIAKNMYAVIRMLGANIQPSATQTAMGKDMWAKWKKGGDTKHLTSMNAKMDQQGVAEDWNKVNHHDKTDGLSQKAVNAYRRENPGSKLQTAVTTKPSKLKKGSKAAKRRKSFCARMSGNKGPMKKPNGKPTPKALALRRWNCESIEQMQELIMLGEAHIAELKQRLDPKCWKGKHKEGTKIKGGVRVNNCVPNK